MNEKDLMNAFSGIDPKYIDEAAFELHDSKEHEKKAKIFSIRKTALVLLPAAAAVLITVSVLYSGLARSSKSESASYAPAESMADEAMPAAEAEPADETSHTYEAEEAPSDSVQMYDNSTAGQTLAPTGIQDESLKEKREPDTDIAVYENGILTIAATETLPEKIDDMEYTIVQREASGEEKTIAEGILGNIMKEENPLTLDLADLHLPSGNYILTIADRRIGFTVK
ncbi:MAG: hypothetical protein K6F86_11410 [Lachnospiraceae bacterium]|nr:hypothetical protein [Lachnospiraceae bacterium]